MRNFLARQWFLLLVAAGALVIGIAPQLVTWTSVVPDGWAVAFILFLSAATLDSRSLLSTLARPWAALWAVCISYGLLPAIAWLVGMTFPQSLNDIRIGLMIVATVPCTMAAAMIWTRLGGGNEATALLVTLLTTSTSWLITTAWLTGTTGISVASEPVEIMTKLIQVQILPVALAQGIRLFPSLERLATGNKSLLSLVSQVLILIVMLKAGATARGSLGGGDASLDLLSVLVALPLCLGIHLAALTSGFWSSKFAGFDRPNQIAVAIAGSQKTLPVCMLLFNTYYGTRYPLAVFPLVFYHVGQLILDTFIANRLRERAPATK